MQAGLKATPKLLDLGKVRRLAIRDGLWLVCWVAVLRLLGLRPYPAGPLEFADTPFYAGAEGGGGCG